MKRLQQMLAVLVALAMLGGVVEAGLRLAGFAPRTTINRFDPLLGWTKRPNASARRRTAEYDVTIRTNSRGLREPEAVAYAKPAGVKRILVVGDSFTLGTTVDRSETISASLQERLRREGRRAQVLNGGTEGYATDQEVLWLAAEGHRYTPDVVVLQMYENDIYWNSQDHYLRYPKPRLPEGDGEIRLEDLPPLADPGEEPWLVRRTALGALLERLVRPPSIPLMAGRALPAEWEVRLRDDAPGTEETARALRAFRRVAERIAARPLVLIVPDKAEIDPAARRAVAELVSDAAYDPDRPFRFMAAAAERAGLPVVDPRRELAATRRATGASLYFAHDWHTNGRGNRVLAGALATALAAPALLGAPPRVAAAAEREIPARATLPWRGIVALAGLVAVLGTLYARRFPEEGAVRAYGGVAVLVLFVVAFFRGATWALGALPEPVATWLARLAVLGLVLAIGWYLRDRFAVMAELFASFVRRGHWYMLPVLGGLLTIGALLVVAASSPWLAPFVYTLF